MESTRPPLRRDGSEHQHGDRDVWEPRQPQLGGAKPGGFALFGPFRGREQHGQGWVRGWGRWGPSQGSGLPRAARGLMLGGDFCCADVCCLGGKCTSLIELWHSTSPSRPSLPLGLPRWGKLSRFGDAIGKVSASPGWVLRAGIC